MGKYLRYFAFGLFAFMAFVNSAFAQTTFYWNRYGSTEQFPSAYAACPGSIQINMVLSGTLSGVNYTGGGFGNCNYKYGANNDDYPTYSLSRGGDACPPDNVYDEVIGGCVIPPPPDPTLENGDKCEDQTGATAQNPFIWQASTSTCVKFFDADDEASCKYMGAHLNTPSSYTVAGVINSSGNAVAPPTFAATSMSCTAATVSSSECSINVSGAISCNVLATFTGEVNGGSVDAQDALCGAGLGACPDQEPKVTTAEQPCVPAANGSGGTSCTQSKETVSEGQQNCGTVNGSYKCFTKLPSSNAIITQINSSSQTLPNGSVEVTVVKDSSNMVCTDVGKCTTTHSTTTTKSTSSTSGGTSTSSSCSGICTPAGGGVETLPTAGAGATGPGAGGGGTGGNGEGEEEGPDGSASAIDDCELPPPCDGDPFQCAILIQAHKDTCKLMQGPTVAEKAQAEAKIAESVALVAAAQSEMDSTAMGLLGAFQSSISGGSTGGAACLPDVPLSVMGHTVIMEFSKTCPSLAFLRYAVLATAYLFAAGVIFREF